MAIIDFDAREKSLTKQCMQYMWSASYYFPCCPKEAGINPLTSYFKSLKNGSVFAYNDNSPKLIIVEAVSINNNSKILVICEREGVICEREGFQPWLIAEIIFENGLFIHSSLGRYFEKDEADKEFYIRKNGFFEN